MEVAMTACPDADCALPAEVLDQWWWPSTDGPVHHLRTRCVNGHIYDQTTDNGEIP